MSALDDVVRSMSLATDGAQGPRRTFTVSARAGILATRRASVPWGFGALVLRAGACLAPRSVARADAQDSENLRVISLEVRVDLDTWDWVDLAGVLEASLHDDERDPPSDRWRALIGRVINEALATEPRWVELHTPSVARRWTASASVPRDHDPYEQQRIATEVDGGGFSVRIAHAPSRIEALWSWAQGRDPLRDVARDWAWATGLSVVAETISEGIAVERLSTEDGRTLSAFGRWWPREDGGLFLRRDGLRIAELSRAVEALGLHGIHGDVEAPTVGVDADGRHPRRDAALDRLVAWLSAPPFERPTVVVGHDGRRIPVDALTSADEVVHAWQHQASSVGHAVTVVTPAQLEWLQVHTPATFVPLSVSTRTQGVPRIDLTALAAGSLGPIRVGEVDGQPVHAYVHRYGIATQGQVRVHGFGRVLAEMPAPELPGVTVVCSLGRTASDATAAGPTVDAARACAHVSRDLLTQAVLLGIGTHALRLRVPWFAHQWNALSPHELRIRYVVSGDGARLVWSENPLLGVVVAHERDGTPRTAHDALVRIRDVGGIVVAEGSGRWRTLESSVPAWSPWLLTEVGAEVLGRLVSNAGLWRMPMVPEAQLRPDTLRAQRHVRLSPERAETLRETLRTRGSASHWARRALLAHALWARAHGEDDYGLSRLALVRRYDPSATRPRQWTSVAAIAEANAPVVPVGSAHRDLPVAVIEATPGLAHALVEVQLATAEHAQASPLRSRRGVAHRHVRHAPERVTWVRTAVVDAAVVGALTLGPRARGVEVWSEGLRTRVEVLPAPFDRVSGRVWLRQRSVEARVRGVLLTSAASLVDEARRLLPLAVPGSARARGIRAFVDAQPDPPPPQPSSGRAPVLGSDRLAATLRFALGRAVTVEVSRLSWALVRDDAGLDRIRLGGLHGLVRAAKAEDARGSDVGAAALAVLFDLHRGGRLGRDAFDIGTTRVLTALA